MKEKQISNKRPFRPDALFRLTDISSPGLSPDGRQVVCVLTRPDLTRNTWNNFIALLPAAGGEPQFLTEGDSPAWSPDGSMIAYLGSPPEGSRDEEAGASGIWIYHLDGQRKRFLAPLYESDYFIDHLVRTGFAWSPDGRYIAYLSAPPEEAGDAEAGASGSGKVNPGGREAGVPVYERAPAAREPGAGSSGFPAAEVREINRLLYKSKGGRGRSVFSDERLTHIYLVPSKGGRSTLVTPGTHNEHSISWSPDSSRIAFISNRSADPDNNQRSDLWTVNIRDGKVRRLTEGPGTAFQPAWSPLGDTIAFLAITAALSTNDSLAADTHLYLTAADPDDGSAPRCLTRSLDRRVENISWDSDGKWIYFTAGDKGSTPLYRVQPAGEGTERVLEGAFRVAEYSLGGGRTAFVQTGTSRPPELFVLEKETSGVRQLTFLNLQACNEFLFGDADPFWFDSFDGTPVQGWIMKPAGFDPTARYPLVLVIHGGPHNMFGFEFEARMQLLAGAGYAVLYINPRGSSGYGQAFSSGCVLNWGGGDYQDLMAGTDHILEQYDWIDGDRLGLTGQSYGGYMANWIITRTHRFKAAVVDGGISNLISFAGTSLYHSLIESEFGGSAYDRFPLLWQWSPLRNAKNVRTPTLFLHGETDNEVPVTQAEEMYVALKKCGVDTSLVQYIGEGHGWRPELRPGNRLDLFRRTIAWLDRYLK